MATIALDYDIDNVQAQKTLEYIFSLGLFTPSIVGKVETISEKRKNLDDELKNYLVDLSGFKFNRETANIYE